MKKQKLSTLLIAMLLVVNSGCNSTSHPLVSIQAPTEQNVKKEKGVNEKETQEPVFEYDTKYEHNFEDEKVIGKFFGPHLQEILRQIKGKSKEEVVKIINAPDKGDVAGQGTNTAVVREGYFCSALHIACTSAYIKGGGQAKSKTKAMEASLGMHKNLVVYLLNKGANPEASDVKGLTPLHYAARNGLLDIAELFIRAGADVDAAGVTCSDTQRHFRQIPGGLKWELQQGSMCFYQIGSAWDDITPWVLAAGNREMRQLLEAHGAQSKSGCCTLL